MVNEHKCIMAEQVAIAREVERERTARETSTTPRNKRRVQRGRRRARFIFTNNRASE